MSVYVTMNTAIPEMPSVMGRLQYDLQLSGGDFNSTLTAISDDGGAFEFMANGFDAGMLSMDEGFAIDGSGVGVYHLTQATLDTASSPIETVYVGTYINVDGEDVYYYDDFDMTPWPCA